MIRQRALYVLMHLSIQRWQLDACEAYNGSADVVVFVAETLWGSSAGRSTYERASFKMGLVVYTQTQRLPTAFAHATDEGSSERERNRVKGVIDPHDCTLN